MQLAGIHHLTAVTAKASGNHAFYTGTLGMRLVKKTVNQDDVSAYHLFYADGIGSPGTDLTFFDWPAAPERRGTRSVIRTGLRVSRGGALDWWAERLREKGVAHETVAERDGRRVLDFEDPEGQRLRLVEDEAETLFDPWNDGPVPAKFQIRGLGPITISVPVLEPTEQCLIDLMNMRRSRDYTDTDGKQVAVFEMGEGGASAELHVAVEAESLPARIGAGGVHHLAFRIRTNEEYEAWRERLDAKGIPSSGPVDRYYFKSLYFREPNGILFELATDEPGFTVDEPAELLGKGLALPPFLEPRRQQIEAGLKPLF